MTTAAAFVSYEISPVYESTDGTCEPQATFTYAELLADQQGGKAFWSLYGRSSGGISECIADRDTFDSIRALYEQLTGNAGSVSKSLPAAASLRTYDAVDAAYIFSGLQVHLETQRARSRGYSLRGAGELEDFGFLWAYACDAAIAVDQLIDPDEYDRLGVFAYECLQPDDPLIAMLFDNVLQPAALTVEAWCESAKIRTRRR